MIPVPLLKKSRWWSSWPALALLCFSITLLLGASNPVRDLSDRINDGMFRIRNRSTSPSTVSVVVIDDASLAQYGRWPWPRGLLAHLITAVSARSPDAIGLDILLSEPSDKQDDLLLAQAIGRAGNVVLAEKLSNSATGPLWIEPLPSFVQEAAGVGHVQAILDGDGVCRRLPFEEMTMHGPVPMLAAVLVSHQAAAQNSDRLGVHPLTLRPSERIIDYRGLDAGVGTVKPFQTISAASILNGSEQILSHRIVLIGFAGSGLEDELLSPLDYHVPAAGVMIQANMADTLARARTVASAPMAYQIFIVAMLCILGSIATRPHRAMLTIAWLVSSIVIAYSFAFALFVLRGLQFQLGLDLLVAVLILPMAQLQHLLTLQKLISNRLILLEMRAADLPLALAGLIRLHQPVQTARTPTKAEGKLELISALEERISLVSAFQHTLLQAMRDGIAVFTPGGNVIFQNPAWESFQHHCRWTHKNCWSQLVAVLRSPREDTSTKAELAASSYSHASLPSQQGREVLLGGRLWHLSLLQLPTSEWSADLLYMALSADLTAQMERDQAREQALQFITHELRTPLVSLQGFAELLQRFPQQAEAAGAAGIIQQESERLVALTTMYLECLRLETTLPVISPAPIKAGELLRRAAQLAEPLCAASNKRLVVTTPSNSTALYVDIGMLTSALLNLIANALKYGNRDSAVYARAEAGTEGARLTVCNAGPQIPEEQISRLFTHQHRMPHHAVISNGWGIGLAFVKRVIEAHDGSVQVTSNSEETCFELLLPIARPSNEERK